MSRQKFNHYFYIRSNKVTSDQSGTEIAPVYVRLVLNKERKEFSAGVSGPLKCWSVSLKLFDSRSPAVKKSNNLLKELEAKIDAIYWELRNTEEDFETIDILNKLNGVSNKYYLLETFNVRLAELNLLIGSSYEKSTIVTYEVAYKHLEKYLKKEGLADVELKKLNSGFVKGFKEFLMLSMTNNSANKYMRKLRAILMYAKDNELLDQNPFSKVSMKDEEVVKFPLSRDELKLLTNKKISNKRLSVVRDMFLIQCYTGLSFADIKSLTDENVVFENEIGYLVKGRKKSKVQSIIPLIPEATEILNNYRAFDKKGTILPVLSNQKTNEYLKEIADICGVNKHLTSHIGRHTFATTITLNEGIGEDSLKHMMGLTSTKHLARYAKMNKETLSKQMRNRGLNML